MRRQEFGCYCGVFSLALSSNGIFIPGSKNTPIYKSLFPFFEMNETVGHYVMRATNENYVICETLVNVLWIGHHTEPEPFLGLKSQETKQEEFRGIFDRFIGKKVELSFIPFSTEVKEDDDSKETQTLNEVVAIDPRHHNSLEMNKSTVTNSAAGENSADYIIREYIDFVNQQVGVYMDAMSGFAGNHARVERQVCRVIRKSKLKENDEQPMVWASYEDPSKPDIIHNRIVRSSEYLSSNSVDGPNAQQHSQAILVFLFTYWEDEIRPRLAKSMNITVSEIKSDIMGDLRIIRNVILHSKGIIRHDKHKDLKLLREMFAVGQPVYISYEDIHKIFILIKQDCARLLLEWLGMKNSPNLKPEEFADVALQLPKQSHR
jgi:hypothetical protein